MKISLTKRIAGSGLCPLAVAALALIASIGTAAAQQAYPAPAVQYYGAYQPHLVSRPVTSSSDINTRDPYHLPESYNYDWPYGMGLSH